MSAAPRLAIPDAHERDDLATFVARVVRLDPAAPVRLRGTGEAGGAGERVEVWATTPFDTLVTAGAAGTVVPVDLTVMGSDVLAALSVVGGASVEPGTRCDERWRAPLPPDASWDRVDDVPLADVNGLADEGIATARASSPSGQPSADLLDTTALTLAGTAAVRVPLRCVFALAGMGLLTPGTTADGDVVRVSTGGSPGHDWLRLDAPGGAVVRRRRPTLVLRPV